MLIVKLTVVNQKWWAQIMINNEKLKLSYYSLGCVAYSLSSLKHYLHKLQTVEPLKPN